MNKKGIKKYLPGAESLAGAAGNAGTSGAAGGGGFADKAGAFMGNYGGAIGSAASSLMPLLMKKPDPNAKPYKKGTKLIKYRKGGKDLSNLSLQDSEELVKGDLLSNKDRIISKLPKFAQKAFAKKAMTRIEEADKEYNNAYKDVYSNRESAGTPFEENRVMRQIVKKRQTPSQSPTVETPKEQVNLLNTTGPRVTENNNTNMDNSRFEKMMSSDIRKSSTGLTPSSAYGTTSSAAKKPAMRQKPAMNAEMKRVAALQQKMKAAGYNIKADGAWGKETQKAYDDYSKGKESSEKSSPFAFTTADKGKGQDFTDVQNQYVNPMQMPVNRRTSTESSADNTRVSGRPIPKIQYKTRSSNTGTLPSATETNKNTYNERDRSKAQDFTTAQDNALKQNKLVGTGATSKNSTRVKTFANGTKKLSGYSKLDSKLGGILPGGVTRAEAKAAKAAKNIKPSTNVGPMAGGYQSAPPKTTGVGPLTGGYVVPVPDLSKPVGPMTDIGRYTKASNMPAPASKSLKTQYEENKGGYSRALKSGKKDSSGNLVDPSTGLAYKQLPARTGGGAGGSGKGGSKPATTAPKGSNLFKNGMAVKNFTDKNTSRTFYTNGRVFDKTTGKMGKYSHDLKSNKINIQFDKAKAAPVKKRKGDDTYMDEVIDTGSRIAGSIGGGLLAGGTTFGVGSVAGAVAGDRAGKAFGNYLNKKLGYREEDDKSQEGYSLGEGAMAGLGGPVAGKVLKAAAPLASKAGGALIKYATKEGQKIAAAPLGRALSSVGRSKAGQVVGNVASKAKNAVTGGSKAAAQTTSKVVSKVNAPGAMSKVAPTAQSSRAVGNLGAVPTKAPLKANSTVNPKQLLTKRGATSSITAKPAASSSPASATAQSSAMGPAQANLRQSASNAAKTAGRKAINFVKNNKKKTAIGAGAAGGIGAGIYAASKMRTNEG